MKFVAFVLAVLVSGTALGAVTNFLGANSDVLRQQFGLTGEGVQIGQVEIGRPGKPGYDTQHFHSQVTPTQVYAGTVMDAPESGYLISPDGNHATQVAGIMIGKHTPVPIGGVAPDAQLHAAAILATGDEYGNYGAALNRMATVNGGATVATNMSSALPSTTSST
jgi:hypothetical protein